MIVFSIKILLLFKLLIFLLGNKSDQFSLYWRYSLKIIWSRLFHLCCCHTILLSLQCFHCPFRFLCSGLVEVHPLIWPHFRQCPGSWTLQPNSIIDIVENFPLMKPQILNNLFVHYGQYRWNWSIFQLRSDLFSLFVSLMLILIL